ncbi:hypothetical protein J6590_067265 [Homalodisca vitripennis]|nr:hypothetical protein J6590_067265 [Homalodisca vitripennis]
MEETRQILQGHLRWPLLKTEIQEIVCALNCSETQVLGKVEDHCRPIFVRLRILTIYTIMFAMTHLVMVSLEADHCRRLTLTPPPSRRYAVCHPRRRRPQTADEMPRHRLLQTVRCVRTLARTRSPVHHP